MEDQTQVESATYYLVHLRQIAFLGVYALTCTPVLRSIDAALSDSILWRAIGHAKPELAISTNSAFIAGLNRLRARSGHRISLPDLILALRMSVVDDNIPVSPLLKFKPLLRQPRCAIMRSNESARMFGDDE
jgi:hypothetical protein